MAEASPLLRTFSHGLLHWCPGCEHLHAIYTTPSRPNGPKWDFNGDLSAPTFGPSVKHSWGRFVDPKHVDEEPGESGICHYFIRSGQIEFCSDSTHAFAGKTVPLPELPGHVRD